MACTSALCVPADQLHAQVIGGMVTSILAQQYYCKLIDGSLTVETKTERKD